MFGFFAPVSRVSEWRRSYARICQYQREFFGLTSLPFLSYEATFLYQLGIEFGLVERLPECSPECCRLRKIRGNDARKDKFPGAMAAAFGLMLAGVKLADDVDDSGRWYNRIIAWKYKRQVTAAHEFWESTSPGLLCTVRETIDAHRQLERKGASDLNEYCVPTGRGFGSVFEAFARALGADDSTILQFREIGRCVGASIVTWDCAVDFDHDRIRGHYNPLQSEQDVRSSLDFCELQVSKIGWAVGSEGVCGKVAFDVSQRVRARRNANPVHRLRRFERWGLVREKGYAYAKCDCDICCIAEVCECGGGETLGCCFDGAAGPGCEGACCFADCGGCCVDGPCGQKKRAAKQSGAIEKPSPFAWCEGKVAVTDGSLEPAGYVNVDGERVPARSVADTIMEDGTECIVDRADPFGVYVRMRGQRRSN